MKEPEGHYFVFPLAVLLGPDPLECLERAMQWGVHSAGIGFRKKHGEAAFEVKLGEVCAAAGIQTPPPSSAAAEILIGAEVSNTSLESSAPAALKELMEKVSKVESRPPYVRMKASSMWAALERERSRDHPGAKAPERSLSWREFRILCALLSSPVNRRKYSFLGWESIQARSCGHASKAALKQDAEIRPHLPPLTRKQIRMTLDTLEELKFFARFHFSSGKSGGLTAYSFRLDRKELGEKVCADANFRDRIKTAGHRREDAATCARLLGRAAPARKSARLGAKSGPSQGPT